MNEADRKNMHCLLVARMLTAGVNNAETAGTVAEEFINEQFPELFVDEKTQRRIRIMEDNYDRNTFLSKADKERHKRVEREFMLREKGHTR